MTESNSSSAAFIESYKAHTRAEKLHLVASRQKAQQAARDLQMAMEIEDRVKIGTVVREVEKGTRAMITGRTAVGLLNDTTIEVKYQARRFLADNSLSAQPLNIASGTWVVDGTKEVVVDYSLASIELDVPE